MKNRFVGHMVFCCCLCLLLSHPTQAQSYFHAQVKNPNDTSLYHYFLSVEADGSGTLRMAYAVAGKAYLAEVMMADSMGSGATRFLVPRSSPRYIKGDWDDELWLPRFQFEGKHIQDSFYHEPTAMVLQRNDSSQVAQTKVLQQWHHEDLLQQKDLLLSFYQANEPFYVFLTGFSTRSLNNVEQNRKFYLILVANTNDPLVGASAKKDMEQVYETFSSLTLSAGIGFVPIIVSGDNFNLGSTRRAIDTIQPGTTDIVFFYYSGHGYRNDTDKSPYPRISFRTNNLQVRADNNLSVEEIYQRLLAKRALVTIVLSDCCNEKINALVPFGYPLLRPRSMGTAALKLNHDQFRKLFLPDQRISLIIGTASAKQLALGNPTMGGYFTHFFKAELVKSLYSNAGENNWLGISVQAAKKTSNQSLTALCPETPNLRGRCIQQAKFDLLPKF